MKTAKKPATSKLVTRFDNELKNLLMADLQTFRSKSHFYPSNHQVGTQQTLNAA